MDLFLDANVYLSFYRLSADDLEELRKLIVTVREGETVLYITDQVRDEFRRNRESVISESLRLISDTKIRGFPQLFVSHPDFGKLNEAVKTYEDRRIALFAKVETDAAEGRLLADELIDELFRLASTLHVTDELMEGAQRRVDVGNPPGKKGSLGDTINWTALLDGVPHGTDLLLVTADSDYTSPLDSTQLSEFLRIEWTNTKASSVIVYRNLTSLFTAKYPHIKMAAELAKDLAITRLVQSTTFEQTHRSIARLAQYSDFTAEQVESMLKAANRNSQIRWILSDPDVEEFYLNLVPNFGDLVDQDEAALFWKNYELAFKPGPLPDVSE
jgi:PIN domain